MNTSLIDRYVKEVGRHLPRKTRSDVEAELHSLLSDSLRDRTAGKEPLDPAAMEAEQIAVLKAFGPPNTAADRYAPPRRYLIGPNVYDIYTIVLFSVWIAISAAVLLLAGLGALGGGGLAPQFGSYLSLYFQWLLAVFGSITLVFAIVGRLLPEDAPADEKEEVWDPRTLPAVDDKSRIDVRGILFEIFWIMVALVVFNLFPDWIGMHFAASVNDAPARWYSIPLLSDAFFSDFLALWNIYFLLSILLHLFLLRRGRWERITRIIDFLLAVLAIGILAAMLAGPALIDVRGVAAESARDLLQSILSPLLKWILAVSLIVTVADAVGKLVNIFRGATKAVPEPYLGRPVD
ncbi:MAG: hypothetical protein JW748_10385 [Anaerolineales bacterium]|nr:hypothetical protein [Anaerolineales bacterium]